MAPGDGTSFGVVVVSYRSAAHLGSCIAPWLDAGIDPGSVVVVDNASDDASVEVAKSTGCVVVANEQNVGFGRAVNQGADEVGRHLEDHDWLLVINPDVEATSSLSQSLEDLAALGAEVDLIRPTLAGSSGPNMQPYPTAGRAIRWIWASKSLDDPGDAPTLAHAYLIGSVLAVRWSAWCRLGGFDERFFLYAEDADLSARARGLSLREAPLSVPLRHHGNSSLIDLPAGQQRLMIEGISLFNHRCGGQGPGRVAPLAMAVGFLLRSAASIARGRLPAARRYGRLSAMGLAAAAKPADRLNRAPSFPKR